MVGGEGDGSVGRARNDDVQMGWVRWVVGLGAWGFGAS